MNYKCIKVGVTGHRELLNSNILKKILSTELKKLLKKEDSQYFVISPLADGADRIVAKILINDFNAELIVPLPFEKEEYQKDFSTISQKEFNELINKAIEIYEVTSLNDILRQIGYLKVGQEVVNRCDVLIAIWDGEDVRGVGGTGDIVMYAEQCKKPILYINTESLNIKYMNFQGV